MGTRSWTRFYRVPRRRILGAAPRSVLKRLRLAEETGVRPAILDRQLVGVVYRQYDGYPEYVGCHVADFLLLQQAKGTSLSAEQLLTAYLTALSDEEVRHHVVAVPPRENRATREGYMNWNEDAALFIEWVYDVEVPDALERDVQGSADPQDRQVIALSIIPGAGGCDLVLGEGEKEAVAFRGEPQAVKDWIAAGPYHMDNKNGVLTVLRQEDSTAVRQQVAAAPAPQPGTAAAAAAADPEPQPGTDAAAAAADPEPQPGTSAAAAAVDPEPQPGTAAAAAAADPEPQPGTAAAAAAADPEPQPGTAAADPA